MFIFSLTYVKPISEIVCNCTDMEEAKEIMEKDPFFKEGIAQYEVIEFVPSKSSEEFQTAISACTQ